MRISSVNHSHKEKFAQYLTPIEIASFMAKMTTKYCMKKDTLNILDPGAGSGILSCSLMNDLIGENVKKNINFDAYEIDNSILDSLEQSYQIIAAHENITYNILNKDFITSMCSDILRGINKTYDIIIMNPPYKKINTNSEYRRSLHNIGIETVNIYSAFMAVAIKLLAENGILTAIVPRSFCNGFYFRPFRKFLYDNTSIQHIHIFESRRDNFKDENVLQENIIIILKKDKKETTTITVSYSKDKYFDLFSKKIVHSNSIIDPTDKQYYISIPGFSEKNKKLQLDFTNKELGFEISTGPIVDFRMREKLVYKINKNSIPLLYAIHIRNQKITWPIVSKKPNAIVLDKIELGKYCFEKGFYIVLKRFSSKEEKHRIQATLITPNDFFAEHFTVENHLNIIHHNGSGLDKKLASALVNYLNSDCCDRVFREFSGHTQVNATDLRNMKYPNLEFFRD
jgi:adenine-specific DNA-methyltransferase